MQPRDAHDARVCVFVRITRQVAATADAKKSLD